MFFKTSRFTAIDIGTYAVKVVRFTIKDNRVLSVETGITGLPRETIQEGFIEDQGIVATELEKTFSRMNYKPRNVVTTVSNNNLIIRNLEMPVMEESELKESIKWEASDQLPYSAEEVNIDYIKVDQTQDNMQVLIAAVKQEVIDNYVNALQRIGIKPDVMNVQPMAILSLLEYQGELTEPVAVIDIGAASSQVTIGTSDNIFLSRTINTGGNDFTGEIMENQGMSYQEAEEHKFENGLEEEEAASDYEFEGTELDINSFESAEFESSSTLKTMANDLSSEISRSLDFFSIKHRGQNINRVFITGGGSRLKGLREIISREIDQELTPIQTFRGFDVQLDAEGYCNDCREEFAVAVGLGLSEVLVNEG